MATLAEIEDAVCAARRKGNDQIVLLRCASAYPAVADGMNLRTMVNMRDVFRVPVGLSDHSMGSAAAVAAVALGACVIEKHLCAGRDIKTPDSSFSMEPEEFKRMVDDIRQAEKALGEVWYGQTDQEESGLIFRRSVFCVRDIKKGETLTEENVRVIRPGYGLAPGLYHEILGQKALRDIQKGTPLRMDMCGCTD